MKSSDGNMAVMKARDPEHILRRIPRLEKEAHALWWGIHGRTTYAEPDCDVRVRNGRIEFKLKDA